MKNKENTLGANEQMAFLNTTKLAVALKRTLMVLTLCIISALCIQAEESTIEPSDSIAVTGPKKSHWLTGRDYIIYDNRKWHNEWDYAQVKAVVKVYNEDGTTITDEATIASIGEVSLERVTDNSAKGTVEDGSPVGNETSSAYINWHCNIPESENNNQTNALVAAHKLHVKLTAALVEGNKDYIFAGWSTNQTYKDYDKGTNTTFEHTSNIANGGSGYGSYASKQNTQYEGSTRYTETFYAKFVPVTPTKVTLAVAENGTYHYSTSGNSGDIIDSEATIESKERVSLTATSKSGYKFFGWYTKKGSQDIYFSYDSVSTSPALTQDTTIYAKFIPSNWATYIVKGEDKRYFEFDKAEEAAASSSSKVFLPITDGIVPYKEGGYSIRSGVTLLIPYEETYRNATNTPDWYDDNANKPPKSFRTLTLAAGAKVTVNGAINVNAKLRSLQNTNGAQSGASGMINMQEGSTITLNSGANLYCWGIIYGKGEITANSGATVYESFQVNDYPGGSIMAPKIEILGQGNPNGQYQNFIDHKVFPVRIFCFPNIQSKLHLHYGATEKVATAFASLGLQKDIVFISKSEGLFTITSEGSYITKWYDTNEDLQHFELKGEANLKSVQFEVGLSTLSLSKTINSADYILPFTHNMRITLLPKENGNGTVNVTEDIAILPGAKISVGKNVTVKIAKDKALYVYDIDQWENNYTFADGVNKSVVYNRSKTISYDKSKLTDAVLEVAGTIEVNGAFYTTSSGADIKGIDGGKVVFASQLPQNLPDVYQFIQSSITYPEITVTSAQLHNDETIHSAPYNYTQTSGAAAGDEFWYVESLGKWVKNEFGPELDIVDADGTNLTINANGWASSGWPYTVNGVKYEKDDRQPDRTLVIPYTGTSGASLPIVVLNKDGKPICRHIYKVPFVDPDTEDMSDMNKNSIVFVKSSTLKVGTASAKEIYVAPGAELEVTGTLTVGKLVLRTTPYKAAVLTNNGTINGQVYYSRIVPDSKQYYQFGLPLSCPLANVKMSNTDKLGGSQPKYGTAWMLKSYSEYSRANNGIKDEVINWSLLPSEGTITAGVGYEMFSNSNYYREFYFPVNLSEATTQVSVQYTKGTKEEHNGWNIITSPLTSRANVPIIDPATAFKVCWLQADGSYEQELPTVFPPAIPFSIQTSAKGELNFAIPTIAATPRKQSAAEALTETEWVHLDIFDTYGEGDETSLFVHPTRFEQTYKTGIDVAKQSLTAARPIIYSTHAYGDMAFAGIADSLLENGIDLAVYSPSAQELTFSLRENKFLHRLEYLWLADNETGARTDLLMDDYTCRANAGTTKGRFVLNGRFKAPQISTGIGNTQTDYNIYAIGNNIAISGVEQGTPIYIFDAVGHMIYTTSATSDEVIVPAPCAGVYMLTIGGQTAKLVVNK
ncbi:MAG: InlB B-repeat-containing protein [Paludibacteraceae bacterium]|nr:InlB B-repeat-containing protein [Paludibacteraceae bacterium]